MQLIFIPSMLRCPCLQPQNSFNYLLPTFWFTPSSPAQAEGLSWFLPFELLHLQTRPFHGAKLRRTSSCVLFNPSILETHWCVLLVVPYFISRYMQAALSVLLCLSLVRTARTKSSMPWIMRAGSAAYISMFRSKQRVSSSGETSGATFSASPAANHGLIFLLCHLTHFLQRLMHVSPWTSS